MPNAFIINRLIENIFINMIVVSINNSNSHKYT